MRRGVVLASNTATGVREVAGVCGDVIRTTRLPPERYTYMSLDRRTAAAA